MISVGPEHFTTKKALIERCKHILRTGVRPEDQPFLQALLGRHPNATVKIGAGISEIIVHQETTGYKQRCFAVRRVDGTMATFSYPECGIAPKTQRSKVVDAFRNAISTQVISFRDAARDFGLAEQGDDVDHGTGAFSFSEILRTFCEARGLVITQVAILELEAFPYVKLASDALREDFAEYHKIHAALRMTAADVNRKQGNGIR